MKVGLIAALIGSTAALNVWRPQVLQLDVQNDVLDLHKQLVEIPSISNNETAVAEFLVKELERRNYNVLVQNVTQDGTSQNIIAFKGHNYHTKVLLTSHFDTVPPYWPYRREGDYIYGRGSVDAKSCVAAQICAFDELVKNGEINEETDLALLFVVGEEVEGTGMKYANEHLEYKDWDAVIFGEPTESKLGVGHKGYAVAELKAHGVAAHSGYPELGVSATEILIGALHEILSTKLPESDLLGPSTVNIGKISGGVAANVIPSEAHATVTFRIASDPGSIKSLLDKIVQSNDRLEITNEVYIVDPQYLDYEVDGFDTIVLAYSTDIPNLSGEFSRYLYGPGSIHVAHSDNEYVRAHELIESVDGYKRLVLHSLKH